MVQIFVVYRESDSFNFAAFLTSDAAMDYINERESQLEPGEANDFYIDEIPLHGFKVSIR